jgi:putative hydrolase
MDIVGPSVVPSVRTIRRRFDERRREAKPIGRFIRRMLGVEMKLKQYAEGARFVRVVIDEVGMSGLNTVWSSASQLPTGVEIRDPKLWLERVGAPPAVSA